MKKTILYASAVLLLSVCAVLLFAVFDNTSGGLAAFPDGPASVSFTRDKTVLPDFIYNGTSIAEFPVHTIHLRDGHIVDEADAEFVVLGTVIEIFYTFADGAAWTQANIRVDEVTRGGLSESEIISVYFPGGYAAQADVQLANASGKYASSDAEYIEFVVNHEPHPKPGDNAVYYLSTLPEESSLPRGAYLRLNVPVADEPEADIVELD